MTVPEEPPPGSSLHLSRHHPRRRDTLALAAGSTLNGLLAYVFFALTTRSLGAAEAAPVSVLWTYWALAAAALTFPVQHWIARTVAVHQTEGPIRRGMSRILGAIIIVAAVSSGLAWLARDSLFHRSDAWFPLLIGAITIGSGLVGIARGVLAARHRFVSLAAAVTGEGAVRSASAAVLAATGHGSAVGFGLCLVAGSAVVLAWTSAFRLQRSAPLREMTSPISFLSASSSGQLLSQLVLTGGPLALTLAGGSAGEVTTLFAVLALFRAPYTLSLGVLSQLTGILTRHVVRGETDALRRFRVAVLVATATAAVGAALVGATIAPALVHVVFGSDVDAGRLTTTLVATGSAFAIASLVVTIAVMAQDRPFTVVGSWTVALVVGAGAYVVARREVSAIDAVSWAFLLAELVGLIGLVASEVRGSARLDERHIVRARTGDPTPERH